VFHKIFGVCKHSKQWTPPFKLSIRNALNTNFFSPSVREPPEVTPAVVSEAHLYLSAPANTSELKESHAYNLAAKQAGLAIRLNTCSWEAFGLILTLTV
jgi:hypothetical protein